jgi:protein TonB
MKRDLLIGFIVAILVHGGLAIGGDFFKSKPGPPPVDDTIPVIEIAPPPPEEPEIVEMPEGASEGGGDLSDIVPSMQADNPAPTASPFTQPIQPHPLPTISPSAGPIIPLGPPGQNKGGGPGTGFKNLFDLASLDKVPVPRVPARLNYPPEMSRAGIEGEVLVGFIVDSEGNVRNPYVISSSHREFEAEALRTISRYKFKPGRKNGVDVSTSNVHQPFVFKMRDN